MTVTPELLADLRKKAEAAKLKPGRPVHSNEVAAMHDALLPSVVLAMLDRIAALEEGLLEMGGIALKNAVEKHGASWHGRWCGCASCIAELPERFAAPRDP